jgi:hypothetical protein
MLVLTAPAIRTPALRLQMRDQRTHPSRYD